MCWWRIFPPIFPWGDADGLSLANDKYVAKCHDNRFWLALACRSSVSMCIPVVTGGTGWGLLELMQKSTAYEMPTAITVASSWSNYLAIPREHKVLFYWWTPDNSFVDMFPKPLEFPTHDAEAWAQGDKRTAEDPARVLTMASSNLQMKAPTVYHAMSLMSIDFETIEGMLLQFAEGQAEKAIACKWLQDHAATWQEWIPTSTMTSTATATSTVNVEDRTVVTGCTEISGDLSQLQGSEDATAAFTTAIATLAEVPASYVTNLQIVAGQTCAERRLGQRRLQVSGKLDFSLEFPASLGAQVSYQAATASLQTMASKSTSDITSAVQGAMETYPSLSQVTLEVTSVPAVEVAFQPPSVTTESTEKDETMSARQSGFLAAFITVGLSGLSWSHLKPSAICCHIQTVYHSMTFLLAKDIEVVQKFCCFAGTSKLVGGSKHKNARSFRWGPFIV